MIGSRCIVILPDRDVDPGVLAPDEIIELRGTGTMVEASKVKRPSVRAEHPDEER